MGMLVRSMHVVACILTAVSSDRVIRWLHTNLSACDHPVHCIALLVMASPETCCLMPSHMHKAVPSLPHTLNPTMLSMCQSAHNTQVIDIATDNSLVAETCQSNYMLKMQGASTTWLAFMQKSVRVVISAARWPRQSYPA